MKTVNFLCLIQKADILGPKIGLEIEKSIRFRSISGGIFSLIIIVSTMIVSALLGTEILVRKKPSVVYSDEFTSNSMIRLQEISMFFDFSYANNGTAVEDYSKYVTSKVVILSVDEASNTTQDSTSLSIEPCNFNNFSPLYQPLYGNLRNQTNRFYCVSLNSAAYVLNEKTTINSREIRIIFRTCISDCMPAVPLLIGVSYLSSSIDATDAANPVKYSIQKNSVLAGGMNKINFYQFKRDIIESDEGWILESNKLYEFISSNPIEIDIAIPKGEQDYTLYSAVIHSKRSKRKILRSYMKIQELAAKVGGFVNLMIILFNILTSHYLRHSYLEYIYSSLSENYEINYRIPKAVSNPNSHQKIDIELTSKVEIKEGSVDRPKFHNYLNNASITQKPSLKFFNHEIDIKKSYFAYLCYLLSFTSKKRAMYFSYLFTGLKF